MKNKYLTMLLAVVLFSTAAWANIGPQSINITFNGSDSEGWKASSNGSITGVANGVANVQMAVQNGGHYRADMQHQIAGTFTFDKTKDVVWAIKLTGALPGTTNSRKFEINYKTSSGNTWINRSGDAVANNPITPSGTLFSSDGGVIYYYDLSEKAPTQWGSVPEGVLSINNIHFIMADAKELTDETARYSVDWIATFTSVNDLKSFKDWKDEQTDLTKPYHELCFRPKADGSGYDACRNGFKDVGFEGNYNARFFAVEYFLVEDFKPAFCASEPSVIWHACTIDENGSIALENFSEINALAKLADAILIGSGLTNSPETVALVKEILKNNKNLPTVLDADAISKDVLENITEHTAPVIITPHEGEFLRIATDVSDNTLLETAKKYSCTIALKSNITRISDGQSIVLSTRGCPALARAGSGDILCALMGSLLANKHLLSSIITPTDTNQIVAQKIASIATQWLGETSELIANQYTENVLATSDIINFLHKPIS